MHPALHIREIAAAIASQVDPFDKRDLASLARTCRSLSEPALDVLWKAPSAWNLALRMTRELWIVKTMTYGEVLVGDCDEESMEKVKNPDSWRMLVSPLGPRPHTRHLRHAPILQTLSPAAESIAPQYLDLGLRFASYARRVRTLLLHESADDMMDERGEREVSTAVYALWTARAELFPGLDDLTFARKYLSLSPANETLLLAFLRTTRLRALTIEVDRTGVELLERNRDTLLAGPLTLGSELVSGSGWIRVGANAPRGHFRVPRARSFRPDGRIRVRGNRAYRMMQKNRLRASRAAGAVCRRNC
jgi:hypothetical protein